MNDDEILKIVLTNLINMLTERGELKKDNLDKNIKKIINAITEEKIFKIKSETSNTVYNIMIINGKISTVNKINGFDSFISSTNNQNRIFIGNNISQKAFKQFLEKKNSEVFFEKDLILSSILLAIEIFISIPFNLVMLPCSELRFNKKALVTTMRIFFMCGQYQ